MFQFTNTARIAIKEEKAQDLTIEILKSNSSFDIASKLAELLIETQATAPIVVSREEYDTILKLFRVRGFDQEGNRIGRGRKRHTEEE